MCIATREGEIAQAVLTMDDPGKSAEERLAAVRLLTAESFLYGRDNGVRSDEAFNVIEGTALQRLQDAYLEAVDKDMQEKITAEVDRRDAVVHTHSQFGVQSSPGYRGVFSNAKQAAMDDFLASPEGTAYCKAVTAHNRRLGYDAVESAYLATESVSQYLDERIMDRIAPRDDAEYVAGSLLKDTQAGKLLMALGYNGMSFRASCWSRRSAGSCRLESW